MEDIIDIIVTETTNTIEITAQPNDEIIDVNIIDNREDIVLNVTPTVVEININSLTGNFGINWGDIDGTLSNQTDLQNALNLKADLVDGKVPSSQLPSYVDDIVEVATYLALPTTGETGKIYVVLDTNLIYRWSGSAYIEIKDSSAVWGAITGTLSSQTDLQNALNAKFNNPTGDTTQYIAGDGSLITFPVAGQAGTLVREVRNTTGATLTKGTIVYISGATGNKPTVSKAIATGDSTSAQTFGMCQANIANNANGYVVCVGDITGLDTSALTEGAQLYLSSTTAGTYTTTKQLAPAHLVYIGVITRSHPTQGQIEVKIQNGYELDEIHDVAISSVANNDGIFYESSTSLWKNKSIATVLGYTPADGANYLPLTGGTLSGILRVDSALRIKSGSANGILLETYNTNELRIRVTPTSTTFDMNLVFPSASKTYTFPNATGTIALTSDLSSYQPLLTNPVTGTGTSGIIAKFNGTSTITDSIIYDNGTRVSIGADVTTSNKFTAVASTTSSYAVVAQASGAANGFWATLSGSGEIFRGQTSGGSYFIINNGGNAFLNGNLNVGDFASTSYKLNVVGTGNFTGALSGTSATFVTAGKDALTVSDSTTQAAGVGGSILFKGVYTNGGSPLSFGRISLEKQNSTNADYSFNLAFYTSPNGGANPNTTAALKLNYDNSATFSSSVTATSLFVNAGSGSNLRVISGGTNILNVANYSVADGFREFLLGGSELSFYSGTAGGGSLSERMRITSSGNVGIGTTSPSQKLHVTGSGDVVSLVETAAGSFAQYRLLSGSGGTPWTLGTQSDYLSGSLVFRYSTNKMVLTTGGNLGIGTDSPNRALHVVGGIELTSDLVSTKGGTTFRLGYDAYTTTSGVNLFTESAVPLVFGTSSTERMRITSDGSLLVGVTSGNPGQNNTTTGCNFSGGGRFFLNNGGSDNIIGRNTDGILISWRRAGVEVGTINVTSSATSYNTSSDYRLKQDLKPINGLDLVNKINVYNYQWKTDNSRMDGVLAHELSEVLPYAVTGVKDGERMQSVDYSKIVPVMIQAIKEEDAKIIALQNKVIELETEIQTLKNK